MRRHFPGAYILAALELLTGVPLALATIGYAPLLFRGLGLPPNLDDYIALAGMALPGVGVTLAGAATMLHSRLGYTLLRRVRWVAIVSEVGMMLAGAGIWAVVHRRGGDWAGVGFLEAWLFLGVGTMLLLLSLLGLRYLRRLRAEAE